MADSTSSPRRQPPSPLTFSPETVLPPIPVKQPFSVAAPASSSASRSDTVSMPFVKRHVTRRLKTAKAECDKELHRVTNSITSFFEEKLRESELDQVQDDRDGRSRDRDSHNRHGSDSLQEPFVFQSADLRSALGSDDASSDGGYEAEIEFPRHSRQRASLEEQPLDLPRLTHWSSSPGLLTASTSSSPGSLRRQHTLPKDKPINSSSSNLSALTNSSASSSLETTSPKKQPPAGPPISWNGSQGAAISRRLSRSIHIPVRPVRSGQSSRSTSRSRSPLPRPISQEEKKNRRSSRVLIDDPVDPIMTTLYDIISVATDITEMSIGHITSQPKICEQLVQRVQNIGKAWDEHPDWHGRNWYVQVLLAVASLSRVIEWWEAEKQFWNFDEKKEEDQDEPLIFVMKPAYETQSHHSNPDSEITTMNDPYKLSAEEDKKLKLVKPPSLGRRSRDEATKDISVTPQKSGQTSDDPDTSGRSASKFMDTTESARVLATERLRLQAETAQNHNIVMELSLDGDHILWINYAWQNVVGTDPEELQGSRMSLLLAPSDWTIFRDATRRLQDDDSHTVEVRFKLRVEAEDDREGAHGVLYRTMEGKGMLMVDRDEGQPSHTMWVIKPVSSPQYENAPPSILLEQGNTGDEPRTAEKPWQRSGIGKPIVPFPITKPINTSLILCRICECSIPQWYFEKHNETCSEVHRLEAEIGECNESVAELRNTIRELMSALDQSSPVSTLEYRGMPIFSPSSSPGSSSPLQMLRAPLKMQRIGVKKMQRQLLEKLDDILLVSWEVSVPALKEDESKEPIERQRLLSPGSERKMSQVRNWSKPSIEDAALTQLADDAERIMRQKVDNVIRMQNVIKYSEKIRQEWEERVEEALSSMDDAEDAEEEDDDDDECGEGVTTGDDEVGGNNATGHSSATSEYASGRDGRSSSGPPSSDPTPMGSASPVPSMTRSDHRHGRPMHTRPSTPSSVSSPLALAIPITASRSEDVPPPMDLNDPAPGRSPHNLEAKLWINPTLSPVMTPFDAPTTVRRTNSRRLSTIAPIVSPTTTPSQPLSPRLPSIAPSSRTTPTSIKDFEIIKPISKGAFGSVFLARKKVTGDYFAIKVLKKADMIAKNQITNVKAERMILMQQAESPFVTKLYWTFQSKENLYLVMEYLNGGDCAALIKSLGSLPEEWTKNYIAEVVLGLEYLHQRGVVHRDLKPDNLLIDQHGHLKLTDFGLSRIGLLGRQTREGELLAAPTRTRYSPNSRPPSIDAAYLSYTPYTVDTGGSYFNQRPPSAPRLATSPYLTSTDDVSESSGSESFSGAFPRRAAASHRMNDSPLQSFASELTTELRSHSNSLNSSNPPTSTHSFTGTPPTDQKFVGTPDYLAPETILGLRGDDAAVDWWALGVITYEFLYGIPPFHDDTPEKVFENILSGQIEWHEEWVEYTPEARDFMQRLMTLNPTQRLGANGAEEVKAHPFLAGIDWNSVTSSEAAFIPQVTDPESTDYFDPRGAVLQLFNDEEHTSLLSHGGPDGRAYGADAATLGSATIPVPVVGHGKELPTGSPADDDFGTFSFKNLPVLKQANDDVIRKLKTDQMTPMAQTLTEPNLTGHSRRRSLSQRMKKPPGTVVTTNVDTTGKPSATNPPSPATSTSSIASSPSRCPSTPGSVSSHIRKPSEYGAVERFKLSHLDGDILRRNSMPSRLRTASVSTSGEDSIAGSWGAPTSVGQASSVAEVNTPPSSVASIDLKRGPDPNDRAVTCLLAEDNPITAKIIETLLSRLGCRCVVVADGSEAISVAMGDIKFDCILMDLHMPIVDGESAARYIKSTNNKNASTPIIAVSAYSGTDMNEASNLFAASLAKPLQKADLVAAMRQLGFKTSPAHERVAPKVHAR